MSAAVLLFGYALLLGTAGAHALAGAAWADRAPRLGIAVWQALSASVIAAVLLAGMALTIPSVPLGQSLAELLQACAAAIQAQYATPGGAMVGVLGSALAAVIVVRAGYCLVRELILASRERRGHRQVLALVGRRECNLGVVIVEHDAAVAYCLPGRPRQIVLTSSALAALDQDRVTAVLAHERAHLRGRHHLVLAGARGLRRAFPFLPCFGLALRAAAAGRNAG